MNHYLAITIGPIYDTLLQARKTRELWAASYVFSRLMDLLLEEVDQIGGTVLLPRRQKDNQRERFGAGIYNDRLFARMKDACDPERVESAIDRAVKRLADELTPNDQASDPAFWRQYFRIEWACKPLESLHGGALFTQLEPVLHSAELHTPYLHDAGDDHALLAFLGKVYQTKLAGALKDNARGVYNNLMKGGFPSTADLATFELFQNKASDYDALVQEAGITEEQDQKQIDKFYELLYQQGSRLKNDAREYHKYFCIVHADGDNLSSLNASLNSEAEYIALSEKLSGFALDAAKTINDYGGKPVYIGGDDLLFLAPVCARKDGQTVSVFELIDALGKAYEALNLGADTSLSFGITLTYYKYPLFEAHAGSYAQLTEKAKKARWKNGSGKNAVAFRLLKHSGAYFEGVLAKPVLEAFVGAEAQLREGADDLLSGIVFKMDTLNGLIGQLADQGQLSARIGYLFDNFFNESVHKRNRAQMDLVRTLLETIHDHGLSGQDGASNLYAILRLLKFTTDKRARTAAANNQAAGVEG